MEEKVANETQDVFAQRIKNLGKSDLIALRRAFGLPLKEVSGAAMAAFYKACFSAEEKEEAAFLAACAIAYVMHYGDGGKPLHRCFRDAEVAENRIKELISNKYVDKDGFFHAKYSRLIRYSVSKGALPNINEIYNSLVKWYDFRKEFIKNYFIEQKEE